MNITHHNIPSYMDLVPVVDQYNVDSPSAKFDEIFAAMSGYLATLENMVVDPAVAYASQTFYMPAWIADKSGSIQTAYHTRLRAVRDNLSSATTTLRLVMKDGGFDQMP